MKCLVCKFGETEPGAITYNLNSDAMTLVVKNVPADVCDACGEGYLDAEVSDRLRDIVEGAKKASVEFMVRKYVPANVPNEKAHAKRMDSDALQDRRARDFIDRITREVELVPRANGYDLQKPGSTRIGFVRYNIGKRDRDRYRIYAYEPFSDPQQRFSNDSANSRRGWNCLVNPDNDDDVRYVISVLESSWDQK